MINLPTKKSEYLNVGEGATLEKVQELVRAAKFLEGFTSPLEIKVVINDGLGGQLENTLKGFTPNYGADEETELIEYVDNLLYTIELNPVEQVTLIKSDGSKLELIEPEDETLTEIYDIQSKLNDCIDALRSGKKLDGMQEAFLRNHNVIK